MLLMKIVTFHSVTVLLTLLTRPTYEEDVPSFYWNAFTQNCKNKGHIIPLEKYGITANTNQSFQGNKIVIFYEKNVGLYPHLKYINKTHNEFINGGLPQNVDMPTHLKKLRQDIELIIPDPKYDGIAVIDVEEWRPTYDSNWSKKRIYRDESVQLVLTRYPYLKRDEAVRIAKKEFDDAAYSFLLITLKEFQVRRPLAKWGFYGFPICDQNGLQRNSTFCYPEHNEKLIPLLEHTDALYPDAYLYPGRPVETARLYVKDVLKEIRRLNEMIVEDGYKKKEVFVYHKFELDPYNPQVDKIEFYDEPTLNVTYNQTIEFGYKNIILWTTSKNMMKRCEFIKNYIETLLGPFIKKIIKSYSL